MAVHRRQQIPAKQGSPHYPGQRQKRTPGRKGKLQGMTFIEAKIALGISVAKDALRLFKIEQFIIHPRGRQINPADAFPPGGTVDHTADHRQAGHKHCFQPGQITVFFFPPFQYSVCFHSCSLPVNSASSGIPETPAKTVPSCFRKKALPRRRKTPAIIPPRPPSR